MKKLLLCLTVALLSAACGSDGNDPPVEEKLSIKQTSYDVAQQGATIQVDISSNAAVDVDMPDVDWVRVSTNRGLVSTESVKYYDILENENPDPRDATIVFTTSTKRREVAISQKRKDIIVADLPPSLELPCEETTLDFDVEHNVELNIYIPPAARSWIMQNEIGTRSGVETTSLSFTINANDTPRDRAGFITISNGRTNQSISISQSRYTSSDYTENGDVTVLQSAQEGNGINIAIIGDGFTDRDIASGWYMEIMERGIEHFFAIEPHKSFRHLYNVYAITAVSENQFINNDSNTALEINFGSGTSMGSDEKRCLNYTKMAISEDNIDETLLIVVVNSAEYKGTCSWNYPTLPGSHSGGFARAHQSLARNDNEFKVILQHECGHGFAKLQDEYIYDDNKGMIPNSTINSWQITQSSYGWYKNVDFTSVPAQVRWAKYLSDPYYLAQGMGVYEGGMGTYGFGKGVWRPTENSMMRYNNAPFNAPSREAIYYRIHKLALGSSWEYNHADFVTWDKAHSPIFGGVAARQAGSGVRKAVTDHSPPIIFPYSWREALDK